MFVQVLFIGQGVAPVPVFLHSSINHPFSGKRVNIKVLGESYNYTANFSIPVAYYITNGVASSLAPRAVVNLQAPRHYLNSNAYIRDTYSTNPVNLFFGGEPLWYSDVDGNNIRANSAFFSNEDMFVHKNVLLVGPTLSFMIISQSDTGGDRANDVTFRILYLDITPV